MNPTAVKPQRNLTMECVKLLASFFVVFAHATFPGRVGTLIVTFAGFPVPMFFMIAGYFNYGADCAAIRRRLKHILSLILMGTLIYLVWGAVSTELAGGSTIAYLRAWLPDPIEIVHWIVLHAHPYAGQLWYLNAAAFCYLLFWGYTKFYEGDALDYRPLYRLSMGMGLVLFFFGILAPIAGMESPVHLRNGYVLGLPMFGLGLFLRERQADIFARFGLTDKRLLAIMLAGIAFTVLQWYCTGVGILAFGLLFSVVALMLLMISHPRVPHWLEGPAKHFGAISTWIYITHLAMVLAYVELLQQPMQALLGEAEPWLCPLVVLALSIVAAVVADQLSAMRRRLRKKP